MVVNISICLAISKKLELKADVLKNTKKIAKEQDYFFIKKSFHL